MNKRLMTTLGAALALLMGVGAAQAATFTVTTTADSGAGSLRDAITQANATPGADTIVFDAVIGSGTIVLGSTLPFITEALTIDGAGRSITISGNNAVQVMDNQSTLTLNALTIANGGCPLFGCSIGGAGVYSPGGTLTVTNSTFSGNAAGRENGGAIYGGGTLTISNSTFSGNAAGLAGAVFWQGSNSRLTVTNSTFFNNSASVGGGAGGALFVLHALATVTHSTFSGNTAGLGGGAIFVGDGGTITLANSIVAGGGAGGNCFNPSGTLADLGGNLSDDATCGFTQATSLSNTDPQLGPLQDNGGPTQTTAPMTGSPAIDQGVNALAVDANNQPLSTDQRGTGFARISGSTVDRGAFEVQVPAASPLTVTPSSVSFGTVHRFSLRSRLLTLMNNGSTAVTLSPVSVTPAPGTTAGEFSALSLCPRTLAAGKSCTVKVVLFAFELGARSAKLTIPSSASASPLTVPLGVTVTRLLGN
ncbi:MAG: choice-of-anchor D domain-containing protein [Burkholderiales bacterium]|nr:choice-of-anchor D domain-containing protein [Burkholderiales bacterium]